MLTLLLKKLHPKAKANNHTEHMACQLQLWTEADLESSIRTSHRSLLRLSSIVQCWHCRGDRYHAVILKVWVTGHETSWGQYQASDRVAKECRGRIKWGWRLNHHFSPLSDLLPSSQVAFFIIAFWALFHQNSGFHLLTLRGPMTFMSIMRTIVTI